MKAILLIRVSTEAQDLVQQREQVVDAAKRDGYDELILIEDKESAVKLSEEERNDIVHTVLEKIILNRESRYILTINIYNKINEDVKTIKIDTYKKKII